MPNPSTLGIVKYAKKGVVFSTFNWFTGRCENQPAPAPGQVGVYLLPIIGRMPNPAQRVSEWKGQRPSFLKFFDKSKVAIIFDNS